MKETQRSTRKVDHEEKSSGQAKYVADIKINGMLFAKTVRSSVAHAKIVAINKPRLPKGYYIIDYHDIPGRNYVKMIFEDWPIFAVDKVNYIGDPIMIVVGEDKQVINRIIDKIRIEYDQLEPLFKYKNNVVDKHFVKGNINEAFKNASKTIKETFFTGYQEQAYIEPQGMLAYPEEGEKITLIGSMQCPYYIKRAVMSALEYQDDKVRVIQPPVGGAFGGKEEFPSVTACQLAVAVKKIKKPIMMIYEREEDMLVTTKRHPSKIEIEGAVDRDNKLIGLKVRVSLDGGAYIGLSNVVLSRAMIAVTSAYTIDNLDVSGSVYLTNTVPTGAFRGFGAPQMIFSIDMFINHVAKDLNVDPFIYRMNHLAKQGDLTSTSGLFRDPIIMNQMIEKAVNISNYHEKMKIFNQPDNYKGIGMSLFLHGCGFTGDGESTHINSQVRLIKDEQDIVHVYVAAVDMGQGSNTTLKRIVSKTLEIDNERVIFDYPDTDFVPDSGPTVASRTIMIVGGLLAKATQRLKKEWVDGKRIEINENYKQPDFIEWDESKMNGDAYPAYSWGVNVVEVEVSPITYQVTIKGIWSVYDIGKAIDERIVIGQADGGIAQGIAYGYLEVMDHKEGKILQKNMTDYIIPTSVDMAPTQTHLFDNPFKLGPFGAKGVGELSLVGGAPAVALAIENAIGRKVNKIPVTPEYIMELVNNE